MNIDLKRIMELSKKPPIFTPGDSMLWTDPHIAGQMLKTHLDPNTDSASRKPKTIDDIVSFCIRHISLKEGNSVLDAGCGPGLYCERFAKSGLRVTGIDISSNSIAYARDSALKKGWDINYICGNYLDMDFNNEFDAVFLIWWDFCVLDHEGRKKLLENVRRALKPGGYFIFDVSAPANNSCTADYSKWYASEYSFFSDKPHMVFENSFYYPDEFVTLTQYIVAAESETKIFRLYHTDYSPETINKLLGSMNFKVNDIFENLCGSPYSSNSKSLGVFAVK